LHLLVQGGAPQPSQSLHLREPEQAVGRSSWHFGWQRSFCGEECKCFPQQIGGLKRPIGRAIADLRRVVVRWGSHDIAALGGTKAYPRVRF